MSRTKILHTNDSHGRLTQEKAERLRELKAEHNAILLDAGDVIKAGNIAIPLAPDPAWRWVELAGYDAITIGNREFHLTAKGFLAKVALAPCPLLAANIRAKRTKAPLPVQPFVVLNDKIGVLGLMPAMITPRMKSAILSAYLFDPPLAAAEIWLPQLKAQCKTVIALTHIGLKDDRRLAAARPDLSVIIGGHSHTPVFPPDSDYGAPIVQAQPFARSVGLLTLDASGRLIDAQEIGLE